MVRNAVRITALAALFTAAATTGCKPQAPASSVQSLDNFARKGGDVTHNQCRGSAPLSAKHRIVGKDGKAYDAAVAALRTLPTAVQDQFFGDYNGVLMLADRKDFDAQCGSALAGLSAEVKEYLSEGTGAVEACTKRGTTKSGNPSLTLILPDDARVVEHDLVRQLAFVYATVIGPAKYGNWRNATVTLAARFLKDVRQNGRYSLDRFGTWLQTEQGGRALTDFVFAEAFDSYFCSDRTKRVFLADFKTTYVTFDAMMEQFLRDARPQGGGEP